MTRHFRKNDEADGVTFFPPLTFFPYKDEKSFREKRPKGEKGTKENKDQNQAAKHANLAKDLTKTASKKAITTQPRKL